MLYRYEKAFDRVNWVKLLEVLKSISVDLHDQWLIERLCVYMGQRPRVTVKDSLTNAAVIGYGTRRRYSLSPVLFNTLVYAEAMLRNVLSNVKVWEVVSSKHCNMQMTK